MATTPMAPSVLNMAGPQRQAPINSVRGSSVPTLNMTGGPAPTEQAQPAPFPTLPTKVAPTGAPTRDPYALTDPGSSPTPLDTRGPWEGGGGPGGPRQPPIAPTTPTTPTTPVGPKPIPTETPPVIADPSGPPAWDTKPTMQPSWQNGQNGPVPSNMSPEVMSLFSNIPQLSGMGGINGSASSSNGPMPSLPGAPGRYQGQISPEDIQVGGPDFQSWQQFSDAAYDEATRRLDPQWQANQDRFAQDMVNKGLQPGTPAYDRAMRNFEQNKSDAYGSARNQALQQGLAAQQQAFGQGQAEAQLANALRTAQMGQDASIYGSQAGALASMFGSNRQYDASLAGTNANFQLGAQRNALDQALGMGNLDLQNRNADFGNLMQALQFGQGIWSGNNAQSGADFNQRQTMLGMVPGTQQSNIDVQGAFNAQQQAQANNAAMRQQQQAQQQQAAASLAMMAVMLSDRDAKEGFEGVDTADLLKAANNLPVDRWRYKGDAMVHVGTYAQDFQRETGSGDGRTISPVDMFGVLLGSVQEISKRLEALERRAA